MRKLLLILSSASILASGTATTLGVAYNNNYANIERNLIRLFSEVAAHGMRSAILFDINGIEPLWSSSYNYTQRIADFFPDALENNPINGLTGENLVDELYLLAFGSSNYSFLQDPEMDVAPNTNIARRLNNEEITDPITAPDVQTPGTIDLIGGLLNMAFGSGINGQTMQLILNFLNQDLIKNVLVGEDVRNIFEMIDGYLTFEENDATDIAFTNIINALTEKNVAIDDQTFNEVLTTDTNLFFKGLLNVVYQQTIEGEDVNYNEVFFNKLQGQEDERLVDYDTTDVPNLMNSISYFLKFLNSFSRYIAQFDQYRPNPFGGPQHLFDLQKTNQEVIKEVLDKKYKGAEPDSTWFKTTENDQDVYYSVINIQDFAANLQYYLAPDAEHDPRGTNLRKFLLMMFLDGDNENSRNPLATLVIKNGIGTLAGNYLFTALGINADDDVSGNAILNALKLFISSDATNAQDLINDVIYWLLLRIINNESLESIFNLIRVAIGLLGDQIPENIRVILITILDYFNTIQGRVYLNAPFDALYNGELIPDLLSLLDPVLGPDFDQEQYAGLKNIKTILEMNLGELLTIFGVGELPDVLYGFNSTSIADVVNELAKIYQIDQENLQPEYLDYYWNTQDLQNIVNHLSSKDSKLFNGDQQVGILKPLYYIIIGSNRDLRSDVEADKLIIDQLQNVTLRRGDGDPINFLEANSNDPNVYRVIDNAPTILLGLDNRTLTFLPDTILFDFSRLYGQNYSQTDYEANQQLVPENQRNSANARQFRFTSMSNATISIFQDVLAMVGDFANDSIAQLIDDRYGRYFNSDNFTISNLISDGFRTGAQATGQKIEFDLTYTDPDTQRSYRYHFMATKGFYGPYVPKQPDGETREAERGFIVRQFIRRNN